MTRKQLKQVDTVIVGNGPSALILSYILHGNIPIYDVDSPHPDPILHAKLKKHPDLLTGDVDHLTEHFYGSRFPYSTQALPINVLLDTLVRPYGETDESSRKSCVKWILDSTRAVPHVVFGKVAQTGGQWADNPVKASWDIGALSYAGMLSLPGYTFEQYYQDTHGKNAPFFLRPTRRDVAGYLATYPRMVGLEDSMLGGEEAADIVRCEGGFLVSSHALRCSHLVLASGTFTSLVPARPLLQPLFNLNNRQHTATDPVLVIGSGFSAADVILSTPSHQKIVHIYKWAPKTNPSPLRACHQQAYPEYAGVYRKMRDATTSATKSTGRRPSVQRTLSIVESARDWQTSYEGLPNTIVTHVEDQGDSAIVTFETHGKAPFQRRIGSFSYVVGRRGSLQYLHRSLRSEFCTDPTQWNNVTSSTLREKVSESLEVAPDVFITGSLTGDSLIRFAYGACAYAAGSIMADRSKTVSDLSLYSFNPVGGYNCKFVPAMKGLQGHEVSHFSEHELHLDRRKSEVCVESS